MNANVVIITGAGRGIGRAAAIELSKAGYHLALASRSENELHETKRLCVDAGTVEIVPTDVTDPAQVNQLVQHTLDRFGRTNAIVNNAGLGMLRTIESITPADWRAMVDVNLSSAIFLSQAVWPVFVKQKQGVIVNISSPASRDPFPGLGFYGAAKAGLNLLSLELARYGEKDGIRVATISPGATETAMLRGAFSTDQLPADKTMDPADVARTIADCITGRLRFSSGDIIYLRK